MICISPSWCHCHSLSLAAVNPDWFYQNGSASLVPAYPGCPGKRLLTNVVVVVLQYYVAVLIGHVIVSISDLYQQGAVLARHLILLCFGGTQPRWAESSSH